MNSVGQKGGERVTSRPPEKPCYRCGGTGHTSNTCKFRDATCRKCQKKGHIARVCRSGRAREGQREQAPVARNRSQVHTIEQTPIVDEEETTFAMFRLGEESHHPIKVTLEVNGLQLPMEVDMGAAVSVISSTNPRQVLPQVLSETHHSCSNHLHWRTDATCWRDDGGGELWGTGWMSSLVRG